VAAATWQAVTTGGLHAICITGTKFYGTWGDPDEVREELLRWLKGREDLWHEVQSVAGEPLIRINGKKAVPPPHPVSRYAGKAASAASAATAPAADRPPTKSRWKRSAARRVAGRVLRATGARAPPRELTAGTDRREPTAGTDRQAPAESDRSGGVRRPPTVHVCAQTPPILGRLVRLRGASARSPGMLRLHKET
jgi:hypothetical protein